MEYTTILPIIKTHLRLSTDKFDNDSLTPLVQACVADLSTAGIIIDISDPLQVQAIVLYIRAYFDAEQVNTTFEVAYTRLKTLLALTTVINEKGDTQNG